jgi:hypothetical protein
MDTGFMLLVSLVLAVVLRQVFYSIWRVWHGR